MTFLWTDTWSDRTGCWADVYDVGYDVYRTCEATPDPASHLGLCAKHEAQLRVRGPLNPYVPPQPAWCHGPERWSATGGRWEQATSASVTVR